MEELKLIKHIEACIPDPELRKLIFRRDVVAEQSIKPGSLIPALNNIMVTIFLYSYLKFNNDDSDPDIVITSNEHRITQLFNSVFTTESLTLDLIAYALTEMQVDVNARPLDSKFNEIINTRGLKGSDGADISEIRDIIKIAEESKAYAEKRADVLFGHIKGLINIFPILKSLSLIVDGDEIKFGVDGVVLNTGSMITYVDGNRYYLMSLDYKGEDEVFFYKNFYTPNLREATPREETELRKHFIKIKKTSSAVLYAQKLFAANYRNIHKLALAISDLITDSDDLKRQFYNEYHTAYLDLFQSAVLESKIKQNNLEHDLYNWDKIMPVLLIEKGPSNILNSFLTESRFFKLINNLLIRFEHKSENDIKAIEKRYREQVRQELGLLQLRKTADERKLSTEGDNSVVVDIMIRSIINIVTFDDNKEKRASYLRSESIYMKQIRQEKLFRTDSVDTDKKIKSSTNEFIKVFYFLSVFYRSLFKYCEVKNEIENNYIAKKKTVTKEELYKLQTECEDAFFTEAKRSVKDYLSDADEEMAINAVVKMGLEYWVDEFKKICACFMPPVSESGSGEWALNCKLLRYVIGREKVLNMNMFDEILNMGDESEYDIFTISDALMKSETDLKIYEKYSKELFYFLQYNEDYVESSSTFSISKNTDPIYPYVVKCDINSKYRDGYDISNFQALSEKQGIFNIKILTEKQYIFQETYYCIPNAEYSNAACWISPFLINASMFDNILWN